mmetsp:Transcript_17597/g.59817  ORF Transcript_17597/g.59817 Transcript_17597/m.59817 type:complete len:207 (+) Transcript_17597:452-1072(+)
MGHLNVALVHLNPHAPAPRLAHVLGDDAERGHDDGLGVEHHALVHEPQHAHGRGVVAPHGRQHVRDGHLLLQVLKGREVRERLPHGRLPLGLHVAREHHEEVPHEGQGARVLRLGHDGRAPPRRVRGALHEPGNVLAAAPLAPGARGDAPHGGQERVGLREDARRGRRHGRRRAAQHGGGSEPLGEERSRLRRGRGRLRRWPARRR